MPRPIPTLLNSTRRLHGRAARRGTNPTALILVGFMGAGKTTVGRVLAEELGWSFEDLDDRIERRERLTVPEIFRESGETAFRHAEHAALQELLRELRGENGKVVALGGGAFVQEDNCRLIESARLATIFLDASVKELWRRCSAQAEVETMNRPLRGTWESFCDLYQTRRPHYLRAAFTQQTDGKTSGQIATEIIQAFGLEHKSRKRGAKN